MFKSNQIAFDEHPDPIKTDEEIPELLTGSLKNNDFKLLKLELISLLTNV